MRLWSLHPKYLDTQGLVALWREALLARAVLRGKTAGYRHHPQLNRFRECHSPRAAINRYLAGVHAEATARGYEFDRSKFGSTGSVQKITVANGQLAYEWDWLMRKLRKRSRPAYRRILEVSRVEVHPLFRKIRGPVADWEIVKP